MGNTAQLSLQNSSADEDRARAVVEQLFRQHYRALCAYVRDYVHSMDAAEEIVQEVFLKVWEIARKGDAQIVTRAYLYAASRNHAVSVLRHERVVGAHEEKIVFHAKTDPKPPTIEDEIALDALTRAAQAAIARLPEKRRQVFLLSRESGLTYAEIAQVMGIAPKTVEQHMACAFKSLRASLRDLA